MLAIAAPRFDGPSDTFIRNHVRMIAPGATILLCRDGHGADQLDCPVFSGIEPWRPPASRSERLLHAFWFRWRLYIDPGLGRTDRERARAFLETHKPKALLAEYGPIGCLFARACREADVPLFVHFHGYDASSHLRDWRRVRHYRALFQTATGIIAPSKFLGAKLMGIGCSDSKLHIVPCGIDARHFSATRRNPQRILAVGRLVDKKAPHLTIAAFGRIAQDYPDARLDIVGDGPLAGRCRALIDELALQDRVHLHGARESEFVAELMHQASIFVQHSVTAENGDTEGLPVAILEAMASALPVVSTRHSGIPEAVAEGMTGLLVEEHDIGGMAAAVAQLLDDPGLAAEMGAAGRGRVLQNFTLEQTSARLRNIMGFPALAPTVDAPAHELNVV